jgi:hypothetical protein
MKRASGQQGLIVAINPQAKASLSELIKSCGWPVLLEATPLRLRRQLLLSMPAAALFWIDVETELKGMLELLSWLKSCEPSVRRIAVAYRLPTDVEIAVRSAGVHLYWSADEDLQLLVDACEQYGSQNVACRDAVTSPFEWNAAAGLIAAIDGDLYSREPP